MGAKGGKVAFNGSFDHLIDDKGRVSIPVKFREALQQEGHTRLFVTNVFNRKERCLDVYPPRAWADLVEKIRKSGKFDAAMQSFQTFYIGNAYEVQVDRQGRVLIPPKLREFAGLEREVTFHAMIDYFELWDRASLQRLLDGIKDQIEGDPGFMDRVNAAMERVS